MTSCSRCASKHGVRYIAANNSFYTTRKEADAHDILVVRQGRGQREPTQALRGQKGPGVPLWIAQRRVLPEVAAGDEAALCGRPRGLSHRAGHRGPVRRAMCWSATCSLPAFDIPQEFVDAQRRGGRWQAGGERVPAGTSRTREQEKRYDDITDEVRQRLDFELETIERTGYPGYFLIVQDFHHGRP